jgi:hypothetical protein
VDLESKKKIIFSMKNLEALEQPFIEKEIFYILKGLISCRSLVVWIRRRWLNGGVGKKDLHLLMQANQDYSISAIEQQKGSRGSQNTGEKQKSEIRSHKFFRK